MNPPPVPLSQLIQALGEADQRARDATELDWPLALERAQLRVQLSAYSRHKAEQQHLLGEAVALLEFTLMELSERAAHEQVAVALAEAYLNLFRVAQHVPYLTVARQIIRPLSTSQWPPLLLMLARIEAMAGQPALTRHWLNRYARLPEAQLDALDAAVELEAMYSETWWPALRQQLMQ